MKKLDKGKQIELKEFIQETLVQIVSGVKNAQEEIEDIGGEICPTGLYFSAGQEQPIIYKPGLGIVQTVEFDIALSTAKETEGKGSAGISISVINLGARGGIKKSKEEANRVRFTVPVLLPSKFYDWAKEKEKRKVEGKI